MTADLLSSAKVTLLVRGTSPTAGYLLALRIQADAFSTLSKSLVLSFK